MLGPIEPSLEAAIAREDQAYKNGDPAFFDNFADDCTVFRINSAEPFQNLAAYRAFFEPQLISTRREMTILDRHVQMLDGTAVVLQTLQVVQTDVTVNVRQTVVWTRNNGSWKIRHFHTAMIGNPTAPAPTDARNVRVINERIATVAAVLGVAQ